MFGSKNPKNISQRKIIFSLTIENNLIVILGKLIFQIITSHCTHAARPLLPPLCSLSASPSLDTHPLLLRSILSLPLSLSLSLDSWRFQPSKTLAITQMRQLCSGNFRISICFLISTFVIQFLSIIYAIIWILGFELKIFGSQKLGVCVRLQLLASRFVLLVESGVLFLRLDFCFFFYLWSDSNRTFVDFYPLLFQLNCLIELLSYCLSFPYSLHKSSPSKFYQVFSTLSSLVLEYWVLFCTFIEVDFKWARVRVIVLK